MIRDVEAGGGKPGRRTRRSAASFAGAPLAYLGLILAALLFVAPVLVMIAGSLKPDARVLAEAGGWRGLIPTDASFQNYADVFRRVDFARFLLNSLLITGSIVLGGLVLNSMAAYAFARLRWRGRGLCFNLVLALLIIPLEAIAVPLFYEITSLGLRDTYLAQILPFVADAFAIYLFYSFFVDLPRELEEAARVDGAGVLRTFFTVIVPNAKPAFAAAAIVSFLFRWASYLWPMLVTSGPEVRPLPLAIAVFYTLPPLQWGDIMAFGVMMVSPVLIVFLLFQRYFVRGVTSAAVKG